MGRSVEDGGTALRGNDSGLEERVTVEGEDSETFSRWRGCKAYICWVRAFHKEVVARHRVVVFSIPCSGACSGAGALAMSSEKLDLVFHVGEGFLAVIDRSSEIMFVVLHIRWSVIANSLGSLLHKSSLSHVRTSRCQS